MELRERVYSPGIRQKRHSHDFHNVTLIADGQIDERAERGEYRGRASSVVLKAAGCEHETRIGGRGARTLTIEFDSSSWPVPPDTWWWSEELDVVRAALALQRAFERRENTEDLVSDFVATVIECSRPKEVPRWIVEIKRALDENFHERVSFEALARDLSLHPVYVSRAFRRHVGTSMTDYVRALRLREARHLLAASPWNIAAIAGHSGFADSSHLCRTFSDLLHMTPKTYRRLCRSQV